MAKSVATWVVVADAKHARIYESTGRGSGLTPVSDGELSAPDAVPRRAEDTRGRSFDRFGPARHAVDDADDRRRHAQHGWARAIAEVLEEALARKRYRRLVIVAPDRLIGDLRDHCSDRVRKAVFEEVRKDYVHLAKDELNERLESILVRD